MRKFLLFLILAALPLMAQHAVELVSGAWTDLGSVSGEADEGIAYAVNPAGLIVGYSGDPVAFSYNGSMSAVPGLSAEPYHSAARAVNTSGEIAGCGALMSDAFPGASHAFLYNGSSTSFLSIGSSSIATGIANDGTVVGSYFDIGAYQAYSYASSTLTTLVSSASCTSGGGTGAIVSYADAIDLASDLIVGRYIPCGPGQGWSSPRHIFEYASGTFTDLGAATDLSYGGWQSQPAVVSGTVVADSDGHQAFYYNGTWHAIPFLSGDSTAFVGGINGAVIVGWSEPSFHPWMYNAGTSTLTDLGVSKSGGGSYSTVEPMGLNASGQIVGFAN